MTTREELYQSLKRELIGPGNTNPIYLQNEDPEQEILVQSIHGSPNMRYGAGMLFPKGLSHQEIEDAEDKIDWDEVENTNDSDDGEHKQERFKNVDSANDDPIASANTMKPSSMGLTFRIKNEATLTINVKSALYNSHEQRPQYYTDNENQLVQKLYKDGPNKDQPRLSNSWIRIPLNELPIITIKPKLDWQNGEIELEDFNNGLLYSHENQEWLVLRVFNRSTKIDKEYGCLTLTIVLENKVQKSRNSPDYSAFILYQNEISIVSNEVFIPLHEKTSTDEEIRQMNLLYRNKRSYAIGHGVAVQWDDPMKPLNLKTSFLPKYELPVIGSNETSNLELNMFDMSDKGEWAKGIEQIKSMNSQYSEWIKSIKIDDLKNEEYKAAANNNLKNCSIVSKRIDEGIELLLKDESGKIEKCFRWMNRAMVWQQQRSKEPQRQWLSKDELSKTEYQNSNNTKEEFESLGEYSKKPFKGKWRPFQLAFVLMNLKSIVDPHCSERGIVDLIWFPTGGGKTEAYLGLCAFYIFWRRLNGDTFDKTNVGGTAIIMRYTLRLLTAQQFERASSLICACDLIRKEVISKEDNLGEEPISIGLWVGSSTSPNSNDKAVSSYSELKRMSNAPYQFVVLKCPCCASEIGKKFGTRNKAQIKGLNRADRGQVYFTCHNFACEYHNEKLQIEIVDDYIYERPPTLVLGTVDKFAMLTWKTNLAGSIFGFRVTEDEQITRILPPELIIQDELHLISGPLGSMVGMYETMVQTFCNNYERAEIPFIENDSLSEFVPPKIVASTATIAKAQDQVKALYGTEEMCLFPPQAVEFGNTWFSEVQTNKAGRQYVGLCAPGYPSQQTAIVRAYSNLLQNAKTLSDRKDIDYYWTLLGYFNSIRELGGAVSLVDADIGERISQIRQRELLSKRDERKITYQELTSRVESSQIPKALKRLEQSLDSSNQFSAVGICLATNMVATGVDISRFGLMCIHGQPKTTAEYIQASSRVGRDFNGPGLVITFYNHLKPRDKSQYEHFQSYHSRIYSAVEPTSVTPFTINVRERALHAIYIGLIRGLTSSLALRQTANTNYTDFDEISNIVENIILNRIELINPYEKEMAKEKLQEIKTLWSGNFENYGDAGNRAIRNIDGYIPLMHALGEELPTSITDSNSFKTQTSMRGADTESNVKRVNL